MKKLLALLALSAAVCGAAEWMIDSKDMVREDEEWGCSTSGVLVAKNKGVIAKGTYAVPEAGKYAVWIASETRNEGWRKAQIKINGVSFGKFGDDKIKDFSHPTGYWKKMLIPLEVKEAGEVIKVEIVSISSMARFAGVVLSSTPDFDPTKAEGNIKDSVEILENAE